MRTLCSTSAGIVAWTSTEDADDQLVWSAQLLAVLAAGREMVLCRELYIPLEEQNQAVYAFHSF